MAADKSLLEQSRETSQSIADYVIQHGRLSGNHHRLDRIFPDGKRVSVSYLLKPNQGTELEIHVIQPRVQEGLPTLGYFTRERGLSGEPYYIAFDNPFEINTLPARLDDPGHALILYHTITERVLKALRGE